MKFDINCDFGEGYGRYELGNIDILDYISSINVACGFHGGDPVKINNVIKIAVEKGISIGAHPSYPDSLGFGRRSMDISLEDLYGYCLYQISAVYGVTIANGSKLSHVKAHGALYHDLEIKEGYSQVFVKAVKDLDPSLAIMGIGNGVLEKEAIRHNMTFIREAFADRAYNDDLTLVSRTIKGSVLHLVSDIVEQVKNIIKCESVITINDYKKKIIAQSVCIHGDGVNSLEIAKAIKHMMDDNNIEMKGMVK